MHTRDPAHTKVGRAARTWGTTLVSGTFGRMYGAVSALLKRAPLFLFMAALLLAGFAGGLYVARYKVFPYEILSSARKTFVAAVEARFPSKHSPGVRGKFVDVPPEQAAARRFEFIGSDRLADPILVPGMRRDRPRIISLLPGRYAPQMHISCYVSQLEEFPEERAARAVRRTLPEVRYGGDG